MTAIQYSKKAKIQDREVVVEGDREYVEAEFEKLLNLVFGGDSHAPPEMPRVSKSAISESSCNLRQFVEGISPRTNLEYLLLTGYYVEKIEGRTVFTKEDLERSARASKIPLGRNLPRDLDKMIKKKNFMEPFEAEGQRGLRLTIYGEKKVEEMKGRRALD